MRVAVSLAALSVAAVFAAVTPPVNAVEEISFSPAAIEAHVRILADKSLLGRRAGTEFERRAADYVARQLDALGVPPLPSGERLQRFRLSADNDAAESVNVLGAIMPPPGQKSEEIVVLGAHIDHLGPTDNGGYYPGADDNASGVAVALEVAGALARNAATLRRPVVVAFFGAEEIGLIGSRRFVDQGPIEHARIVAMVNIDMIGRPLLDQAQFGLLKRLAGIDSARGIGVIGAGGRPFFLDTVQSACQRADLTPYGTQAVLSPIVAGLARNRSDHTPFERVGIPTLFFGSGESDDYHQPSDTADKLQPEIIARRARVVYETVYSLATAPSEKLPPRENAVAPSGEKVATLRLQAGDLKAVLRDNSDSPRMLSGLQSLTHSSAPDFDAFDPDGQGSSAGLNFEHVISGHRSASNRFTPRHGRFDLYRLPDGRSATLVRYREDSPWDVSSTLTVTLKSPHYVDFQYRCAPHTRSRFGDRGHALFFFANYMNDVKDPAIHFRGIAAAGAEETWITADAPDGHADWNRGGTYGHRDAADIEYDEDHDFKLNSWSYDYPRYSEPFYYGRAAHGMVLMLMFDRARTPREEIRFSLFKFKLPQRPRPAWDFQYVIRHPVQNKRYGFRGRLVWKPWVSREDCLAEYETWRADEDRR